MLRLNFNSGDFLSFEKHRHRVPNVGLFLLSISLCTASATRSTTLAAPALYPSSPADLQTIPRRDARKLSNAHHLCSACPFFILIPGSLLSLPPCSPLDLYWTFYTLMYLPGSSLFLQFSTLFPSAHVCCMIAQTQLIQDSIVRKMALGSEALCPCYKDLPRFVLDTGTYDEDRPILIDAAAPERAITKAQAKAMVERTAQGLQAVGLKRGDTVCVVHLNDVRQHGTICDELY